VLKNIQKIIELFNAPVLPHFKIWENNNFKFPVEKSLLDIVVSNDKQNKEELSIMMELQNSFINNIKITVFPMLIDKYSDVENNKCSSGDNLPKTNKIPKKEKQEIK
jgi:hypothetical protein